MLWHRSPFARLLAVRVIAVTLALAAAPASLAFDRTLANRKSSALTQEDMNRSWDLVEEGAALVGGGMFLEGAVKVRQATLINPAEVSMHRLAAVFYEAAGRRGSAKIHWAAVADFAPQNSKDSREAQRAAGRLHDAMVKHERQVTCDVIGHRRAAFESECD